MLTGTRATRSGLREQRNDEGVWHCPRCKARVELIQFQQVQFHCLDCGTQFPKEGGPDIIYDERFAGFFCNKLCHGLYVAAFQKQNEQARHKALKEVNMTKEREPTLDEVDEACRKMKEALAKPDPPRVVRHVAKLDQIAAALRNASSEKRQEVIDSLVDDGKLSREEAEDWVRRLVGQGVINGDMQAMW